MSALAIAHEIRSQLTHGRQRTVAVMCWGAHRFSALTRGTLDTASLGGLMFSVNGAKFRGKVAILLMPSDTYTVQFITPRGTVADTVTDVYFDDLTELIDVRIES